MIAPSDVGGSASAWKITRIVPSTGSVSYRRPTCADELSAVSFLFLLLTVCSGAAAWRVMTAGVGGANIGAGLLAMFGPWITAGFLMGAIAQQHEFRPMSRRMYAGLLAAAALEAPALFAFLLYLR